MLCEVCKTNQATFFYKQTKNGFTVEKNLCAGCAKKQGLGVNLGFSDATGFSDDFLGGFLGSFLEPKPQIVASDACTRCGMTMAELMHGGRVGCSNCYSVFRRALSPTITKIHGKATHCGKIPQPLADEQINDTESQPAKTPTEIASNAQNEKKPADRLSELKEKLRAAIDAQEYEDAAKYREEIRAIEAQNNEGSDKGGKDL